MPSTRALAALIALPLVTACGIEHGTITGKQHVAAHTEQIPTQVTRTECSGRTCQTVVTGYRDRPEYHPACWRLSLRDASGNSGAVCVSRAEYDKSRVGGQR